MKPAYRPDIDGLRAVAVMGVLLYHYGASWLPGGFTGVDVFFVISGYLITTILRREIEAGEFSILGFYDRRIRRIVPALLVVLAATMAAGWFILMPGDYADLGASAVYAAAGLGNLYFYGNTGYFDQASEMQPLLHTWSLGVEEQFYVVWPMLLWGLMFIVPRRAVGAIIFTLTIGGFVYAASLVEVAPKNAFYFPYARAWELSIGAGLVFLPAIRSAAAAHLVAALGAALIAWSFLQIRATDSFPGTNAAYACVGAALLIWPKAPTVIARALSLRPIVWIGLISYSLYLWHWPVLVLFRHYANGALPTVIEAAALGALSVGLAWLSWRFVERPFRKPILVPSRSVAMGLASIAVIALAGNSLARLDGIPQRVPSTVLAMSSLDEMWRWDCPYLIDAAGTPACQFGAAWDQAETKAVLWGDSHAEHMAPIVDVAAEGQSFATTLLTPCAGSYGGAVRRVTADQPGYVQLCEEARQRGISFLKEHPETNLVIFSAAWANVATYSSHDGSLPENPASIDLMKIGLVELIEELEAPGRSFLIIADVPASEVDPVPCVVSRASGLLRRSCALDIGAELFSLHAAVQQPTEPVLASIADERSDVMVLTPAENMCSDGSCVSVLNGEPLYRDTGHLRRNLSLETKRQLAALFGLEAALVK